MMVGREVDLRGAFGIKQEGCAFHFGKARFLDSLILQPSMQDATAEGGVKFPE